MLFWCVFGYVVDYLFSFRLSLAPLFIWIVIFARAIRKIKKTWTTQIKQRTEIQTNCFSVLFLCWRWWRSNVVVEIISKLILWETCFVWRSKSKNRFSLCNLIVNLIPNWIKNGEVSSLAVNKTTISLSISMIFSFYEKYFKEMHFATKRTKLKIFDDFFKITLKQMPSEECFCSFYLIEQLFSLLTNFCSAGVRR